VRRSYFAITEAKHLQSSQSWTAERGGIYRWLVRVALCATVAVTGCCSPLVRSQRLTDGLGFAESKPPPLPGAASPILFDRVLALCRPALHRFAGPFTRRDTAAQYQETIRPPHSKFHPVPTRPVFAPPTENTLPVWYSGLSAPHSALPLEGGIELIPPPRNRSPDVEQEPTTNSSAVRAMSRLRIPEMDEQPPVPPN